MATDRSDRPGSNEPDRNPDPITGAPGSHPVGTGIGAAAGGATGVGAAMAVGAATGSVAGPVGTAIGIIAGAVVGGLVGKAVGEHHDPTEDEAYWRDEHKNRPYYNPSHDYDRDLAPAYRYGSTVGSQVNDTYPDTNYRDTAATDRESSGVAQGAKDTARNVGHSIAETGRSVKESVKDAFSSRGDDDDDAIARHQYATHEKDIRAGWEQVRGQSRLSYDEAQHAIRDAYDRRVQRTQTTGDRNAGTGVGPNGSNPTGM